MNQLNAYVLQDIKAQTFGPVFWHETDVHAHRAVEQSIKNSEQIFAQYPEDFNLVQIGTYDSTQGLLSPTNHKIISNLSSYTKQ